MHVKTNYEKSGNKYFRTTASIGRDSSGKLIRKEFYGKSNYESGKSNNIIKNLNKLLKTFFNHAVDEGYILKNPCSGENEIKEKEINVFSNYEISSLKNALEGHMLKALILLT